MPFVNPSIDFVFQDGSTLHTDRILKDSIILDQQLLNNLKSSSSYVTLKLAREPLTNSNGVKTITGRLLSDTSEVKAILYDGTEVIFTGIVQTFKSWNLNKTGLQDMAVTIVDIGTVRLKATWGRTVLKGTLVECIHSLCEVCGVELYTPMEEVEEIEILSKTDPNSSCQTILSDMLMECGWCYYFNANGDLCVQKINLDPETTPSRTLWSAPSSEFVQGDGYLYAKGNRAVSMTRNPSDYRRVTVDYSTLQEYPQLDLYKQTDIHVNALSYWDGENHFAESLPSSKFPTLSATSGSQIYNFITLGNLTSEVKGIRVSWTQTVTDFGINGACEMFFTNTTDSTKAWGNRMSPVRKFELDKSLFGDDESGNFEDELLVWNEGVSCLDAPILCIKNASTFTSTHFSNLRVVGAYDNISDNSYVVSGKVDLVNLKTSQELMWVDTSTLQTTMTGGGGEAKKVIKPSTNDNLSLDVYIDNTNNTSDVTFSEISAKADCLIVGSEHNMVNSSINQELNASLPTYAYTCGYIHDRSIAETLGGHLLQYYAYCSNEYSFMTDLDLGMGEVISLKDNLWSTVSISLVVVRKQTNLKLDGSGYLYTYSGYALDEIQSVNLRSSSSKSSPQSYGASKTLRFRGEWQDDVAYENSDTVQDIVTWNGSSWACVVGNTGEEPSSESDYWALLAEAGGNAVYKEYSLSTSEEVYDGDNEWYDDVSDRYRHNLYVWARDCSDLEEGGRVEGTPYYDWQLTSVYQSQVVCTIVPISYSYVIDSRASEDEETEIQCYVDNRGWDVSSWQWTVTPDDPTVCYFDIYERTLFIKKNISMEEVQLKIQGLDEYGQEIEGCSYVLKMKGQNQTSPRQYLGVFESDSMPTASREGQALLEGDCCLVETTDGTDTWYEPWVYRESYMDFVQLDDDAEDWADVMSACGNEALSLMQDNPNALGKSKYSFFQNIIARNITADLISAQTITRSYTEDANGAPLTGYRIDADNSEVKIANATFGNCTLLGDNAVLDTPAITTSNDKSDVDSYSGDSTNNTSYFNYGERSFPSYNGWYSASGTYNGKTVTGYRGTNASQVTILERSNLNQPSHGSDWRNTYSAFTFNVLVGGNFTVTFQGFKGYETNFFALFGLLKMWSTGGCKIYTSGGTEVGGIGLSANNEGTRSYTVYLNKGTYELRMYVCQWESHLEKGSFKIVDNQGQICFATSDGSAQPILTGWSSNSINSLRVNGSVYTFTPKKVWQNNMKKGASTVARGAVSNVDSSTSTLTIDGVAKNGYIGVSWSDDSCIFKWADNSTETISKTSYKGSFSFSFSSLAMDGFVKTTTLLPKVVNQTDIGSTTEGRYGTIYLVNEPQWVSRREYKTDIEDFDENALEAILGTSVKTFRMKTDEPNAPKRLGFIADDTNHYMSQEHEGVSTSGCIGMLIKAIQQMQAEIDSLKDELNRK